jgi:hypothetical protein
MAFWPAIRRAVAAGTPQKVLRRARRVTEGKSRAARPEPEFTVSIFTHGWDPLRFDPDEINAEYDCYRSAGIELVVAAPDRRDESSWLDSVQRPAELAALQPR